MKLIFEPKVHMIGKQVVVQEELDKFLKDIDVSWESDSKVASEVISEVAGRTCYLSFAKPRPGGNKAYLEHILEVGHGSVIENTSFTLLVSGVSRTLTHELVRHRAGWAYAQLSQRYVDESVAEYVVPPDLRKAVESSLYMNMVDGDDLFSKPTHTKEEADLIYPQFKNIDFENDRDFMYAVSAGDNWLDSVKQSHESYIKLVGYLTSKAEKSGLVKTEARKFARQAARSVLPNATETKITCTANARALRHFIEMRGSRHAEPEIRILANVVLDVLNREAPNLFGDYFKTKLPDGTFELDTKFRKV